MVHLYYRIEWLMKNCVNTKSILLGSCKYCDHKSDFCSYQPRVKCNKSLFSGDLDITESFPKQRYQKLLADIPNEVFTPDQLGTYYYAFNTQRAPTNDARVRKALSMTIDRNLIAKKY